MAYPVIDVMRRDEEDGFLYFIGRSDDMLLWRRGRPSPIEVGRCLRGNIPMSNRCFVHGSTEMSRAFRLERGYHDPTTRTKPR